MFVSDFSGQMAEQHLRLSPQDWLGRFLQILQPTQCDNRTDGCFNWKARLGKDKTATREGLKVSKGVFLKFFYDLCMSAWTQIHAYMPAYLPNIPTYILQL